MKKAQESNKTEHTFIPNSVRFLSSCLKIVSSNVRSAGASVAGSISGAPDDHHNSISDWKTERYKEIIKSGSLVGCALLSVTWQFGLDTQTCT
ncbi:hypothetical protein CsSME_00008219 [Camellia sinensis var. sinensis]